MEDVSVDAAAAAAQSPPPASTAPRVVALDAELEARLAALNEERLRQEKWRARVWRERRALLILLGLVLLLLPNFRMARVVGRSMEEELENGDTLLVWKSWRRFSPLTPGDIIVFRSRGGGGELVKRVVFVQNRQGTLRWPRSIRISGAVIPTEMLFSRRYLEASSSPAWIRQGLVVHVLGDNLEHSNDSRDFGPIRPEWIVGKVVQFRQ